MSVTKPALKKNNAVTTNCSEAYELFENTYSGYLTVAEMAHIDNSNASLQLSVTALILFNTGFVTLIVIAAKSNWFLRSQSSRLSGIL